MSEMRQRRSAFLSRSYFVDSLKFFQQGESHYFQQNFRLAAFDFQTSNLTDAPLAICGVVVII